MTVTIRIPEDLLPVTPRDGSQRAEAGDEDPPGRPKNPRGRVFQFLIDQFLIIGFTFATIFAYIWPSKQEFFFFFFSYVVFMGEIVCD